ncbi:MAG: 50S ribosomal protein L22 [Candidatus Saccharimonadia bacterium]
MKTSATAKYVGTSPRKINLIAALIRGQKVGEAEIILAHTLKRATDPVGKVLTSAVANAQNNYNAKKSDLVIESVIVGPAPMLKRWRPRAKGSSASIKKRASHITVVLRDHQPELTQKTAPVVVKPDQTKQLEAKTSKKTVAEAVKADKSEKK